MTPRLRNDSTGYGLVTKSLHWVTVLALAAQLLIGYSLERADDLLEGAVELWLGGEEDRLVLVHASLVLKHQLVDRDRLLNRML